MLTATSPKLAYRVRDITEQTGYSKPYVYKLIAEGHLPAVRVGGSVRVLHADLVAFLEAHRVGGDAA